MRTRVMFAALPALLLCVAGARADVYNFSYVGVGDPAVFGSGTITTGTPYGDGYAPIIQITGTTEAGPIIGLDLSGGPQVDPPNFQTCCLIGPGGTGFMYDDAFNPTSLNNPFSFSGILFDVSAGIGPTGFPLSPISIFGDGVGGTYEFSYGEDTPVPGTPSNGGTQILFTATVTPEPAFDGAVALCLSGLLLVRWCRGRVSSEK